MGMERNIPEKDSKLFYILTMNEFLEVKRTFLGMILEPK